VARRLEAGQLAAAFDPKHALRWTDAIFARVLGRRAPARKGARRR
jgi:hypothetical protein